MSATKTINWITNADDDKASPKNNLSASQLNNIYKDEQLENTNTCNYVAFFSFVPIIKEKNCFTVEQGSQKMFNMILFHLHIDCRSAPKLLFELEIQIS